MLLDVGNAVPDMVTTKSATTKYNNMSISTTGRLTGNAVLVIIEL
jgi:hypothetical protein